MRLAAIDIGTNSVHMIVVRVRPDFSFEVIDREKEMVRLGAGGLDGRKLTREAMSAALQALSKFERLARSHQVDEILAAATSATREAENGGAFLRRHRAQDRHPAAHHHRHRGGAPHPPRRGLRRRHAEGGRRHRHRRRQRRDHARQRPRGEVRAQLQDRRHPPHRALRRLRSDQRTRRAQAGEVHRRAGRPLPRPHRRGGLRRESSARRARSSRSAPSPRRSIAASCRTEVRNLRVPAKSLRRLRKTVVEMDLEERLHMPGHDPRRADLIVAGAVLLDSAAPHARRRGDHAVRPGAARRPRARLHPSAPQGDRAGRSLSRRPATLGDRTGGALQLGGRALRPGGAPGAGALRSDPDAARPGRSRARVARVRGASSTTSATTSATRAITGTRTT